MDSDFYALRVEKIKDLKDNIKHQVVHILEIETGLKTILKTVLEIPKIESWRTKRNTNGKIDLEKIQAIDWMIDHETNQEIRSRNDSRQKSYKHCTYCNEDGYNWKYCWEMQANVKKAKRLIEIDDRDNGPSDTFNSMVCEDPISDDDLDDFIWICSEMTELN